MKQIVKHRNAKVLISGLCLILLANAVALVGVAYNRSGEPEAMVTLTERELRVPYVYRSDVDNTGLSLYIDCRTETNTYYGYRSGCLNTPSWFDRAKLVELGFELKPANAQSNQMQAFEKTQSRQVYLVLEYAGDAYQRTLQRSQQHLQAQRRLQANNPTDEEFVERVEDAEKDLLAEQHANSRLFAIDAGLDRQVLRSKYADRAKYILLPALVNASTEMVQKKPMWMGRITDLLIDTINVPLEHRAVLTALEADRTRRQAVTPAQYQLVIAFGQRLEPWIVSAEEVSDASAIAQQEVVAVEALIDAFYSFDRARLDNLLNHAPDSRAAVLYYQGWAEGGNYTVLERKPCRKVAVSQYDCAITVQDDAVLALKTGFNVTDTFSVTFHDNNIVSIETSSNDQPIYYEARDWVLKNMPEVMTGPCQGFFQAGSTPGDCARAMAQGYRQFYAATQMGEE